MKKFSSTKKYLSNQKYLSLCKMSMTKTNQNLCVTKSFVVQTTIAQRLFVFIAQDLEKFAVNENLAPILCSKRIYCTTKRFVV